MPIRSTENGVVSNENVGAKPVESLRPKFSGSDLGEDYCSLNVSPNIVVDFCQQVSMRLGAGVSLLRVFQVLADTEDSKRFKRFLVGVASRLASGDGLGDALGVKPTPFNSADLAMIRAGSSAGAEMTEKVFMQLSKKYESSQELAREVKSAMRYPAIVGGIAVVVMTGMLLKIVPKFGAMFLEMGAKIPPLTRTMLDVSEFIRTKWHISIIGVVAFIFIAKFSWAIIKRRLFFQRFLLGLPAFGPFIRASMRARFFAVLGHLLGAGVPLHKSLEITRTLHPFYHYRKTIELFLAEVMQGQSLSESMLSSDIFGLRAAQLVETGERSGNMSGILVDVAERMEKELLYKLRAVTKVVEPLAIMMLAIMVGGMVFALFVPMFSLALSLK